MRRVRDSASTRYGKTVVAAIAGDEAMAARLDELRAEEVAEEQFRRYFAKWKARRRARRAHLSELVYDIGTRARPTRPGVPRLSDMTMAQRRFVLALIEAAS